MINLRKNIFNQNFTTMKTKALTILVLLAGVMVFSSCSKYEEGGPMFSKKGALAGEWEFDDYDPLVGTVTISSTYEEELTIEKDGTFKNEITYGPGATEEWEGTWEFVDDKKFVRIVYEISSGGSTSSGGTTWRIYKLKKDELIFQYSNGDLVTYTAK